MYRDRKTSVKQDNPPCQCKKDRQGVVMEECKGCQEWEELVYLLEECDSYEGESFTDIWGIRY